MEDSLPCPAAEGSSNPDSSVRKMFSSSGPDTEGTVDPASSINVEFTTTTPDAEGNSNPALNISIHGLHKCSMMESKSGLESRTAKRLGLPKSPANTLQQKATAQGGPKKRDLDLHRMIFKEHGLPEGSKLAYRVKGKDVLIGYKSGNGIMCSCCDTNVSPSQFEAHAGLAVRRQPYHHIYTSDGLSLHEVSISLINDQNSTAKCFCLKLQCEPDGEWDCPYCTDNVKSKLAPSKGCSSAVRPVDLRLRRMALSPIRNSMQTHVFSVVKNGSFTNPEFDANSCVFCGQCDRLYHFSCLEDPGSCEVKEVWDCKWFCCRDCGTVHAALQDLVNNGPNIIPESLMSILKRNPEERNLPNDAEADVQWRLIRGTDYEEINSEDKVLLWKAKLFLEDSFQPIECCGRNLIGAMVHGLEVPGLDCRGMYCVVITEKADPASGDFSKYNLRPLDLASAGVLRIFGTKVAELPLAVTYKGYRGKGYFRTLLLLIERLLSRLKVEFLVVSVDEDVRSIWINKLGFAEVTKERLQAYVEHPIVMFENTIVLGKAIPPSLAEES
uniref:Uncharacterized protein LOC114914795 n=1 Tax=Elaeis guineensis var. tenera TaxID=51953 RepID=A0A8N4FDG0_ELAGV|nr:uncharacterized protein LOC114914795 [Elaeis guineensis]